MSTKQNKFYETLRQTQANTFSDGLNMDLHPLTTPNTILTDCVNGTMITYNDNEFVLQNERGNNKIKIGDNDHVKLSEGFIPVGMKEHNGILYIVSHNPQTKQSEIGTFPSPNKQQEHGVTITFNGDDEYKANYNSFDQSIIYYDYNVIVTNQDNYTFESDHNSLIVLEHFILNKTGEVTKTKLIPTEENKVYRFTHEGEGTLGYRYRPYYLSSITPSIIPAKNGSNAQLVIEATSDDKELYEVLKTQDDIKFKYDIVIEFVNGENKLEFKSESLNIDKWDYTFNLTNISKLPLQFENNFTIVNEDGEITCKYNYRTGELITTKTINDNPVETIYKEVNFNITPRIYTNNNNYIVYDNLITDYKTTMDAVFKQESWFTMFKYTKPDEKDNKLNVYATLDLSRFDVNWETTIHTINDASYKLYEIDKYGNIKGKSVFTPVISYKSPLSNIVSDPLTMNSHDLFLNTEGEFNFKLSTSIDLLPVQYSYVNSNVEQCLPLTEDSSNKAKYVRYDVVDSKTYNVVLLREDRSIISSTNLWSENMCNEEMKKMIEEYFDKTTGTVNYTINDVEIEDNKIYLLELTFPINGEINKASFIIVTAQKMFDKYYDDLILRMDEIPLNDWFESQVEIEYSYKKNDYRNPSSFINNLIDIERLNNMPNDDDGDAATRYAMQFFLKYNQLFTNPNKKEIPALGEQFDCTATIDNKSPFDCIIEYENTFNDGIIHIELINKLALVEDQIISTSQTSERVYLYNKFSNYNTEIDTVTADKFIGSYGDYYGYHLKNPDGNYMTEVRYLHEDLFGLERFPNWLNSSNEIGYKTDPFSMPWYWLIPNTKNDYGGSAKLMQKLGFNGSMCVGKVKTLNNIEYSGESEKIWIYCKNDKGVYVLGGINLPKDEKTFDEIWKCILKHAYFSKSVNKLVYQYKFKKIDDYTCEIKSEQSELINKYCKIFPSQSIAIDKNYVEYNVQSWSNLEYINLKDNLTINVNEFGISYANLNKNYNYFLNALGNLINNNEISSSMLTNYSDILQFDINEELFIENLNNISNINEYTQLLSDGSIQMPSLGFDRSKNIIFTNIFNNEEYFGTTKLGSLRWNCSCDFNDFWNISKDSLNLLNKYHSLLFYKLTTYNGEQQS